MLPEGDASPEDGRESEKDYLDSMIGAILKFTETCKTPMTVAILGAWETGYGGFMQTLYDSLDKNSPGNVLRLSTWQFAGENENDQLPMLMADKLIELLNGSSVENSKARAKMLAQGVIGIASGLISQGSSDGQKLNEAIFRESAPASPEQKLRVYADLVRRRAESGNGKVIFFTDDLNRLSPAMAAAFLDTIYRFFECPGCIFIIAADRDAVLKGRRERNLPEYASESEDAYFKRIFKITIQLRQDSFNIRRYIRENLDRLDIPVSQESELLLYEALARLSVGGSSEALDQLFDSILLLKSMSGEETFANGERRLALFALLCMQNRFPEMYRRLAGKKDELTPELLASLDTGLEEEGESVLSEADREAFRAFARELYASINTDGAEGLTRQECRAFANAIEVVSSK